MSRLRTGTHTTTQVGSLLYLIGGSTIDDKFNDLLLFDTETLFWSKPETNGVAFGKHRAHSATLVQDKIFVFGGGDGPNYFNTLFVLNTQTLTWSQPKVSGSCPGPRRAHTATLVGNKIYIFGGGDGNKALNELYILDTERLVWSECRATGAKGEVPGPRGYHSATLLPNNRILVAGGSDGQECFSDVYILDTSSNGWSKQKIVNPFPRLAHTASLVGQMLFVFGGLDGSEYTNELSLLNLDTMEWVNRTHMEPTGKAPAGCGYHTACLVDSRLWLHGGYDNERCFAETHILDLGTLAYLVL